MEEILKMLDQVLREEILNENETQKKDEKTATVSFRYTFCLYFCISSAVLVAPAVLDIGRLSLLAPLPSFLIFQ